MTRPSAPFFTVPRISRTESALVRIIAGFKLVKALLFLGTGLALAQFVRHGIGETLMAWLNVIHVDSQATWLHHLIEKLSGVSGNTLRLIAAGSFTYTALYFIEAIGLWFDRPWAEWLTIIGSLLLIPLEVYELSEHATVIKALILIANLAIVCFLWFHIQHKRRLKAAKA
jgi:uncharacterized membrane protein (DUF2068 family)